jgi:sugar phosphate isomerase/epimerase
VAWLRDGDRDLELDDFAQAKVLDDPMPHIARTNHLLDGFRGRIGIHGPVPAYSFLSPDPDVSAAIQRRFVQALHLCEAIRATHMVVHSPFMFLGLPNRTSDQRSAAAEQIEAAAQFLEPLAALAGEVGCTLVLENTWDTSPRHLIELISMLGSEHVRLSLDTGHAAVTQLSCGLPPDYWIDEIGTGLAHVHLSDTDGAADRHWLLGRGSINWHAVFSAIKRQPSGLRLILEYRIEDRRADVFRESAAWLTHNGWST